MKNIPEGLFKFGVEGEGRSCPRALVISNFDIVLKIPILTILDIKNGENKNVEKFEQNRV